MEKKILDLFHALHACPELSGQEVRTKEILKEFLKTHTSLELRPCGAGFYAAHRETGASRGIMLRADCDALPVETGAAHLCGHDGHAAALCGAALALEGKQAGCNVFFLFQPAEEVGQGAEPCCEIFDREKIDAVYGCHNLPGFPFGRILTRTGTFACASRGVSLCFAGAPTHAAYPENGKSPAMAVGRLLCAVPELIESSQYSGMTLCTVIGVKMGEKNFGEAASHAQVWLTLRGEKNADLALLRKRTLELAGSLAAEYGLAFSFTEEDVFPAVENTEECAERILRSCGGTVLSVPMRWSEDFGHYLLHRPGAYFGIGSGETCPALHTAGYSYPEGLLEITVRAWLDLITAEGKA